MNLIKRIILAPQFVTFVLLAITLAVGIVAAPEFRDLPYLLSKTSEYMPLGLTALAMTYIIVTGNIDLSVASGVVLSGVVGAIVFKNSEYHLAFGWVIAIVIGTGVMLGLFNGLLVALLRLPSLVVTLGTMALYLGIAKVLIGEESIRKFPKWFGRIDKIKYWDAVPLPLIIFIVLAIVFELVLKKTTYGRRLFAIGTNEPAARFSAIGTGTVKVSTFILSGLMMGLGAVVLMSMRESMDYKQLKGGELTAITAVVLGGTSIFGGRGSVMGTVLALLLLVVVRAAMGVNNVPAEYQMAVVGILLISSVILSEFSGKMGDWFKKRRKGAINHA